MKRYDFDEVVNRYGTNCAKFDFKTENGMADDVLPLWVADMDFRIPEEVTEAIMKRAEHGIFGYTSCKDEYFEAVSRWMEERHGLNVRKEWLVKTPGIVFALATAVRSFTEKGDCVLIQRPVYYPFTNVIVRNERKVVNSPLVLINGRYEIDFEDFEQKIVENGVKLFILCSPHNPVGRVWTEDELKRIADICLKHGVIIVSDEIHFDFVWEGKKHLSMGCLGEKYLDNLVICTAPSKTFNIAGLQVSNIFIASESLRRKFRHTISRSGIGELNTFGFTACEACYTKGSEWYEQLREYIYGNILFTDSYLKEKLPEVKLIKPEGTYLMWLDFRELNLSTEELEELIVKKAKLWLDGGSMFGIEGAGFQRINAACPRATLKEALDRIIKSVKGE